MSRRSATILETEKYLLDLEADKIETLSQEQKETLQKVFEAQVQDLSQEIKRSKKKKRIVFLFDIEGTTTPLFFVTKNLFPYFLSRLESWTNEYLTDDLILQVILSKNNQKEQEEKEEDAATRRAMQEVFEEFVKYFTSETCNANNESFLKAVEKENVLLIREIFLQDCREIVAVNKKVPYLKKFQGIVWKSAYQNSKEIKGEIFTDVNNFFQETDTKSTEINIYSSGSVAAQKLLFGFSNFGDKTPKITSYHDTVTAGSKLESESYVKIYSKLSSKSNNEEEEDEEEENDDELVIIFVSDSLAELRAASCSNSSCCSIIPVFAIRPQNPKCKPEENAEKEEERINFPSIFTFKQLSLALGKQQQENQEEKEEQKKDDDDDDISLIELKQIKKDVAHYSTTVANEEGERKIF